MAVSYLMNTNPVRDMHEINHHDDPLIFAQQTSVSASNMIPCFPANNRLLMRITVTLYRIVPRLLVLQRIVLFNTSQVRTRSTTKKLNHCFGKSKQDILFVRNRNTGEMLIMTTIQSLIRTINQFLKLVYLRK